MKKSAAARLQTRNLGTSILLLAKINTKTTVPLPNMASKKTTHTPHLKVHQSNRSWHGKKGPKKNKIEIVTGRCRPRVWSNADNLLGYRLPGNGKHLIFDDITSCIFPSICCSSKYSSMYDGKFPGYVKSVPNESHRSLTCVPNFLLKFSV